jgi:hypothetical protein
VTACGHRRAVVPEHGRGTALKYLLANWKSFLAMIDRVTASSSSDRLQLTAKVAPARKHSA